MPTLRGGHYRFAMRVEPENLVAAKVLFESDRTCCICRTQGKPVQIHHIDGDHSNSVSENLAVLCLECHDLTMIKGGFGRKLDATQVLLYKNDWLQAVGRNRAEKSAKNAEEITSRKVQLGLLIDELEELKKGNAYDQIIFMLDEMENIKLRDEYIAKYIAEYPDDMDGQVFFRAMQERLDLLEKDKVDAYLAELAADESWSQIARCLVSLGRRREAVHYYLRDILHSLEHKNTFSAAYYLKELAARRLHIDLFDQAHEESVKKGDRWWELRSLEELGLYDEVDTLLESEKRPIQ